MPRNHAAHFALRALLARPIISEAPPANPKESLDEFMRLKQAEAAIASLLGRGDPFWSEPARKDKSKIRKLGRPSDPLIAEIVEFLKELRSLPNPPTWRDIPDIIHLRFGRRLAQSTLVDYLKKR